MNFKLKYLKYKKKYFDYKKNQNGGELRKDQLQILRQYQINNLITNDDFNTLSKLESGDDIDVIINDIIKQNTSDTLKYIIIQFDNLKIFQYINIKINRTPESIILKINEYAVEKSHIINAIIYAGKLFSSSSIISPGMIIHVKTCPNFTAYEIANLLYDHEEDIKKINNLKPVSILDSYVNGYLKPNIKKYTADELELITTILSTKLNLEIKIFIMPNGNVIFYSIKYLQKLSNLFEYTLEQGLEILSSHTDEDLTNLETIKKLDFIYIAFGDKFKDPPQDRLSPNGTDLLRIYINMHDT